MQSTAVAEMTQNTRGEDTLPLYWGWFIEKDFSDGFLARSRKVLADALEVVPEFLEDVKNFTGTKHISDILLHYTRENPEEVLHCTAMYNGLYPNYTAGAIEYADRQAIKVHWAD